MEQTEFVCRLEVADIGRRTHQLDILVPHVLARQRKGRTLAIDVRADAEEAVRGFVAEESKCCPFFVFHIDEIPNGVRLTVGTPPGGEAMLGALETAFEPSDHRSGQPSNPLDRRSSHDERRPNSRG